MTTHFIPGSVTPAQLAEYRTQLEAARAQERRAYALARQLAVAYGEMMEEYERAALVYVWAKQGMVEVQR